ncbi:hypothetical protein A5674_22185 [Mycobacterium malmoense]|uniref:hypothetical protein n=1 Tax=Mycobacterium malmoense TaxID=1780 RepID=UPI00080B2806|nr:hypothetical protein [Mycobacterium malmoense]OCB25013.1 hypothetical protein A5674_22185 [Mycobacterium malmoense]
MSTVNHERARIASLTRSRQPDDPELVAARQNLKALRLEEHVRRVVAEAPPLTDEQRDRIAAILRSGQAVP